jgi:two-component system, OmpR family, phosphate regulon sensor histidine kinase PhoR
VGDGLPTTAPVEAAAARRDRELDRARLGRAGNDLVAKLRATGPAKPGFRAAVSHELRTPLTSIAGYVEMLREEQVGPLTPAQAAMLEAVDRNTARLRHAIEDVLALSKIESGTFRTTRQPVNLVEVAAVAIEALRSAAAARGLTLRLDRPGGAVIVAGDRGQLGRLVVNLLSNAAEFTPGGGRVTAGVEAAGVVAVLTIHGTGIGIPAGQQPVIGTGFARASSAADQPARGTGLGLVIARTIVANHGGDLAVRSSEGRGTMVTARIPLLAAQTSGDPAEGGVELLPRGQAAGEGHRAAKPGHHAG